jgi:hypothetical protein
MPNVSVSKYLAKSFKNSRFSASKPPGKRTEERNCVTSTLGPGKEKEAGPSSSVLFFKSKCRAIERIFGCWESSPELKMLFYSGAREMSKQRKKKKAKRKEKTSSLHAPPFFLRFLIKAPYMLKTALLDALFYKESCY